MSDDPFLKEYYALLDTVKDYDQRSMTIKGWGVTLSLAALGFGFQYQHYGLFLVSAVSGIAFWFIEGLMKRYQMRYYVRMREIEVIRANGTKPSSPQIDWSWTIAHKILSGQIEGAPPPPERYEGKLFYPVAWLSLNVAFPHVIGFGLGSLLFLLGLLGLLNKMPL